MRWGRKDPWHSSGPKKKRRELRRRGSTGQRGFRERTFTQEPPYEEKQVLPKKSRKGQKTWHLSLTGTGASSSFGPGSASASSQSRPRDLFAVLSLEQPFLSQSLSLEHRFVPFSGLCKPQAHLHQEALSDCPTLLHASSPPVTWFCLLFP